MAISFARAVRPLIVAAHVAVLLAGCAEHHHRDHGQRWPGDRVHATAPQAVHAPQQVKPKPKVKPAPRVAAKADAPARGTPAAPSRTPQAPKTMAAPRPADTKPAEKPVVLAPMGEKPALAEAKPAAPVLPRENGVALTKDTRPVVRPAEGERPGEVTRPAPVARPSPQPAEPRVAAPAVEPKAPEIAQPKLAPTPPAPPTPPPAAPKAAQPAPAPIAPLASDPSAPQAPPKAAAPAPTATDRPPPAAPKAPPAAASPKAPPEGVAALIERTNLLLRIGNVTEARRILEEPVTAKNADAIAELGRTYDPNELAAFLVPPGSADPARAMELYAEAQRLGSAAARSRLEKLKAAPSPTPPAKKP